MDFVTDYSHSDGAGQCWTSDFACVSVCRTVGSPVEIPLGGVNPLIKRRLGVKKIEQIPFVLDQWIQAKAYCVPGVTIKSLAKQVDINHTYLSNYFNRTLGVPFQIWLHTLRIEEAQQIILHNPGVKISEVASAVGIPVSYNFSRWFKFITEMTAVTWRNMCRTKAEKF